MNFRVASVGRGTPSDRDRGVMMGRDSSARREIGDTTAGFPQHLYTELLSLPVPVFQSCCRYLSQEGYVNLKRYVKLASMTLEGQTDQEHIRISNPTPLAYVH